MKKSILLFLSLLLCAALLTGCFSMVFDTTPEPTVSEDAAYLQKLAEVLALLDEKHVDGYDESLLGDYLAQAAISATGDRWSYYISAEDYDSYLESNNNAYVGIGITIRLENEDDAGFTVESVTADGPAYRAGIRTGDLLVAVEGQNAVELGMTETQQLVRGEKGTDVSLTIRRGEETLELTVTRATIETVIVEYEILDGGIAYIKIDNFDANCARDTLAAIESVLSQGAESIIFDLRFNPGGRKNELVEILDYLLPEGPLFRSVDYTGKEEVDYSDADCLELPMAVLVNGDSYSAAEFFAAAMQEYDAAVIVGTQTCGKANYQQTFRLSDGSAVAISTGHYQTPNGVTLEGLGVTPDVVVELDDADYTSLYYGELEQADDAQLQAAIRALTE